MSKRIVFVQQHPTIPSKSGTIVPLRASSVDFPDLLIAGDGKVKLFSVPLVMRTTAPGPRGAEFGGRKDEFEMSVRLHRDLVEKGVMLVGGYHDGDNVRLALINFGDEVRLMEKQVVAEAVLLETVSYFQLAPGTAEPEPALTGNAGVKRKTGKAGKKA